MIKSLRVGAHDYPVRLITSNVSFGYSVHEDTGGRKPRIEINRASDKRQRTITLLHEAIHCLLREYGLRDLCKTEHGEEGVARLLECAIVQLFVQNPLFVRELMVQLINKK